jgi:hypothetical protein
MQDGFVRAALIGSYAAFSFGPYLVWPNRWNIVGHIQFGLFFMEYLIPLVWTDPFGYVRLSTVRLYTELMMLGAFAYLLALPIGFQSPRFSLTGRRLLTMLEGPYTRMFHRRVITVTFLSTVGLVVSFVIMGFVPIFARDPLQAKYFHGEYRDGYLRAAVIFLPSYFVLITYLPLALVDVAAAQRLRYYFLILVGVAAAVGCLYRGELGPALIGGAGIIVVAKHGRIAFTTYLISIVVVITIGTLGNYFLNTFFALKTDTFESGEQISGTIARGAPDVTEGLRFFDAFEDREHFTYGAQFVGGLVPFQGILLNSVPLARYNPGQWAQGVMLGTDDQEVVRNIAGGGLRIAVPISGYAAFGWFGAALMSALAGFLTGYLIRFVKSHVGGSIEQSAVVIAMYLAFSPLALSPTAITWHEALYPMALIWLIYPIGRSDVAWQHRLGPSAETKYPPA